MGGIGSGRRWHCGAKDTVEDVKRLDIRRLQQEKALFEGYIFSWAWYLREVKVSSISIRVNSDCIILIYKYPSKGKGWQDVRQPVNLSWTACHLGGRRPWFICPGHGCNRRVAILYGGPHFVCRYCRNLSYTSQREKEYDRLARRTNKIRDNLCWKQGILNDPGRKKPKGMHWNTFQRLVAKHDQLLDASLRGIAAEIDR